MKILKSPGWLAKLSAIVLIFSVTLVRAESSDTPTDAAGASPSSVITQGHSSAIENTGRGYVYEMTGEVILYVGQGPARHAQLHDAIVSGTYIHTGDNSNAVLKFEDGQVVAMQSNSTLRVREYHYVPDQPEKNSAIFSMFQGGMRFITGLIGQRNKAAFRLATPNATIGIRGTDFIIALTKDGLYHEVLSGSIGVTNAVGSNVFSKGNPGLTSSPNTPSTSLASDAVPADTFSGVSSIEVPPAVAEVAPEIPPPLPDGAAATPVPTEEELPEFNPATSPGGAAEGGAAAASTTAEATAGVSATTIAIGVGVAAGVAAVVNSSTTHH